MNIRQSPFDSDGRGARILSVRPRESKGGSDLPITSDQVDAELSRTSLLRLAFAPAIEARYEAETKAGRAWNIRLTVPMGLIAYNAFTLVDRAGLPDLGWLPEAFRLGVVTPVGLFAMWMCTRVSAVFREAFISYAITATMMIPVGFMIASRAPLAPYTMLVVLLVSMFGNITMRLRFPYACFFSGMTLLSVGALLAVRSDLPFLLSIHLAIAMVTGVSFGIVANNQLERAERRSFLMALREMCRADQLGKEKAMLSVLSLVDPLTGLPNRRAFDAKLKEFWLAWEQNGQAFSILMIDVDYFKRYNDHYGHQAGDVCLARIADALKQAVVRKTDLVARYGGEEFAVLLANCASEDATAIAETLRLEVRRAALTHVNRDDLDQFISVTIGAASVRRSGPETSSDLVADADRALYAAKNAGRNRVLAEGRASQHVPPPTRRRIDDSRK